MVKKNKQVQKLKQIIRLLEQQNEMLSESLDYVYQVSDCSEELQRIQGKIDRLKSWCHGDKANEKT